MAEKETEKKKGDLFSSIGSLVGLIAGGPVGGFIGGVGGALLGGASPDSAMRSGIGSLMPMMFGGKAGGIGNLLSVMGGGMGPQARGAGLMNMFSGGQQNPMSMISGMAGPTGGATRATQGILNLMGSDDPILSSIMREALYQQRRPQFENIMSPMEMRQYQTGERNPDYRGTPVMKAQGGYIEGPGTGTSDSIPAAIYQDGGRVQEAALSDGEFVMTEAAVKGAGGGDRDAGAARMYQMMDQFERRA
jgi:hypothetical protein